MGLSFNFKCMNTHPETLYALPLSVLKSLGVSLARERAMNDITVQKVSNLVLNFLYLNEFSSIFGIPLFLLSLTPAQMSI